MRKLSFPLLILAFLITPVMAKADPKAVTVVELFTTQGCINCPPADKILKLIAQDKARDVITLGCHVTYFDREKFRDALSMKYCDLRHKNYKNALNVRSTYTPQMVINGRYETQGNRENLVRSAIKMSQAQNEISPIEVSLYDDTINITVPKLALQKPAEILLFTYSKEHTVNMIALQKADEPITYVHPVQSITRLMDWKGNALKMAFPVKNTEAYGYAVIAQYTDSTDIVAAGKFEKP